MDGRLAEQDGRDVGRDRSASSSGRELLGQDEAADADARARPSSRARSVDHVLPPRARAGSAEPRPRSGRGRTGRPRRRQGVLVRELGEAATALDRERPPARVLESRDRVEERRRRAPSSSSSASRWRPSSSCGIADDVRAELAQDLQRPVVGRRLDEEAPLAGEAAARKRNPWSEPFVTRTRDGSTPWRSPSQAASGA